jgi:hypothetical protein
MEFFAAYTNILEWEFSISTCKTDALSLIANTQKYKMESAIKKSLFRLTLPGKSK